MARSSCSLSAVLPNSSDESQQLLGPLWGPPSSKSHCGWLAVPVRGVCGASAPAHGRRWARGGGQKQTQIKAGLSLEQRQIWFVDCFVFFSVSIRASLTFTCFATWNSYVPFSCFRLVLQTQVQIWQELSSDYAWKVLFAQGTRSGTFTPCNYVFLHQMKFFFFLLWFFF